MKKSTKIWLITAAALVFLGLVIFGGIMTMLNWNFNKLSTVKYQTNTYEVTENFNNISIKADTDDIVLLSSDDEKCRVVCYEQEKTKHTVTVDGETLKIDKADMRKWYNHISIVSFSTPKITVYLPKTEYSSLAVKASTGDVTLPNNFKFENIDISLSTGDVCSSASASGEVKIKTGTGNISVENISPQTLVLALSTGKINASSINCKGDFHIAVSTGDAKLADVTCGTLTSTGNTGDLALTNVIATESFNIKRTTGDVKFDLCDANEITVETDTGDVRGTLLSEKLFITSTSTGRIDVPKSITGGRCEITTSTGDIQIQIK